MGRNDLYVIEARKPDGSLDLEGRQPWAAFGDKAFTGISEDAMAKIVYRYCPNATLTGMDIMAWPSNIDPRWKARRKYW